MSRRRSIKVATPRTHTYNDYLAMPAKFQGHIPWLVVESVMRAFVLLLIVVLFLALGPFLLLYALSLLGVAVTYSFGQWVGALLILFLLGRGR